MGEIIGGKSVAVIGSRGYPSYYGGFETAVRRLAPYLVEHGWDVTVYGRAGGIRTDDPECDPRVRSTMTAGIESKSLSTLSYGLTSALHAAWAKPDVALVLNVANGFWLPLLKLRGVPTVVNVDGIEWERGKWNRVAKAVFKVGAWLTARFADALISDAEAIRERWQEDYGRDSSVIRYGGDDPGDLPVEADLDRRSYVLLVARFVPENTVGEFLDAAVRIARHAPVVLVGSAGTGGGLLDDRAAELSSTHSDIHWLGHVSDDRRLHALWQHAGVYFHGHSVGGTNPALVQAMACGAPIVARDTVFNREVLRGTGRLVEPTPDEIADAVLALLADRAEQDRLGAAAAALAAHDYPWAAICAAYDVLLDKERA